MRYPTIKILPVILLTIFTFNSCFDVNRDVDRFSLNPINEEEINHNSFNNLIIISTDLNIGKNRFVFAAIDNNQNPISTPQIEISLSNADKTTAIYDAMFVNWPSGKNGVYVSYPYFDVAGTWNMETVIGPNKTKLNNKFIVNEESKTPKVGDSAPKSINKTRFSHPDLSQITSDIEPNLDLYNVTIKESIENSNPIILTFSTPGFCQTATCGPQLQIISSLHDKYKYSVNFIHVEIYDNPHELALHFAKRKISPTVIQWGIFTEPFTFIINQKGIITAKYEGFATYGEIESDLSKMIDSNL